MHSARPTMMVEALWHGPLGIFRDRLRAGFRRSRHRPARQSFLRWHWRNGCDACCLRLGGRFGDLVTAAKADRSQPRQERAMPLLGMVVVGEVAALGPDFVLSGQRQLIDSRHS